MNPRWSVVMPVWLGTRPVEDLRRTLDAYEGIEADTLELVLCSDGPDPRIAAVVRDSRCPFPIRLVEQPHRGQSAASNRAAQEARGEFLLFSAQDIVPHPRLVAEHERFHREHPAEVVLGYLPYPPQLEVTPFMDFLVHGGPQFAYDLFQDDEIIPSHFLYAPNFSIRRETFLSTGGFREDMPYGCQDSELGLRLAVDGIPVRYNASAVGYHWHVNDLSVYEQRQYRAGQSAVRLAQLHPSHRDLESLRLGVERWYVGGKTEIEGWTQRALAEEGGWVKGRPCRKGTPLWDLYDRITRHHFYRGVWEALDGLTESARGQQKQPRAAAL